jgi:hypothetical protein
LNMNSIVRKPPKSRAPDCVAPRNDFRYIEDRVSDN